MENLKIHYVNNNYKSRSKEWDFFCIVGVYGQSLSGTPGLRQWEIDPRSSHDRGRGHSNKIASCILTCMMQDGCREENLRIMRLFETCTLAAYDTFTTKRGYVAVKLNEKKARRIRFNQKVRDIFEPVKKVFSTKKGSGIVDIEDFAF